MDIEIADFGANVTIESNLRTHDSFTPKFFGEQEYVFNKTTFQDCKEWLIIRVWGTCGWNTTLHSKYR